MRSGSGIRGSIQRRTEFVSGTKTRRRLPHAATASPVDRYDYFRRRPSISTLAAPSNPSVVGSGTADGVGEGVCVVKSALLLFVSTPSVRPIDRVAVGAGASAVSKPGPEKPAVGVLVGVAAALP